MGINSGKFFDAELSREYYETLKSEKSLYDGKAAVTRSSQNEFNANELFLGNTARAMKMFIKNGTGKMLNDVTDMYSQMLADQEYIMGTFECIVDNSPNARIEYDTLETINKDFKGFYRRFDTLATQAHETIKNLNKDFGEEVPGGFPQPNRKKPLDSFIDICGGDDPSKGYFKECQNKLTSFDDTIKFYLKGRETPFNSADLNKRIKASSGILRSYSHENPNLDPTKVDEIGEPIIKTAKVINNKFTKLCTGIEKYFDKNGDFNYAHGKNVKGSLPCSFAAIEASDSPISRAILSSVMYGVVKKFYMDNSFMYDHNSQKLEIQPRETALFLQWAGATQSVFEKGDFSDVKKNIFTNFESFQRGGVSYVIDSMVDKCSVMKLMNCNARNGQNNNASMSSFFEAVGYISLMGASLINSGNVKSVSQTANASIPGYIPVPIGPTYYIQKYVEKYFEEGFENYKEERERVPGITLSELQEHYSSDLPDYTEEIDSWLEEQNSELEKTFYLSYGAGTAAFYNKVKTGGEMDIKQEARWNEAFDVDYLGEDGYFLYHGTVMNASTLGNVTYAYVGANYYPDFALYSGGAAVQVKRNDPIHLPMMYLLPNWGDAPEDREAIALGIEWNREGFSDE